MTRQYRERRTILKNFMTTAKEAKALELWAAHLNQPLSSLIRTYVVNQALDWFEGQEEKVS